MRTINGVLLAGGTPNKVVWAPSSSDRFSCRSLAAEELVSERLKGLWELFVLLKVKCFAWMVLRGQIVARDRFQQLGVVQEEGNVCLPYLW